MTASTYGPFNDKPSPTNNEHILNERVVNAFETMVQNEFTLRRGLYDKLIDPRRNMDEECGYPANLTAEIYKQLYDRSSIASRVVQLMSKEAFQVSPSVYEDEDETKQTPFEKAWDQVVKDLRGVSWHKQEKGSSIWEHFLRANILSGIGQFGIMLLGIDDGKPLDQPIDGVAVTVNGRVIRDSPLSVETERALLDDNTWTKARRQQLTSNERKVVAGWAKQRERRDNPAPTRNRIAKSAAELSPQGTDAQYFNYGFGRSEKLNDKPSKKQRKLLYIRSFDESLVQIVRYEWNDRNPRFGMPTYYRVTLNDPSEQHSGVGLPMNTVMVHWSRVIHLADNLGSSETFGVPRMKPVFNDILNANKVKGASAEGYFQSCFMGLSFETHPQLGGDVDVDKAGIRDQYEQYRNGLQRAMMTSGMAIKTLAPSVVDPSPHIESAIESICIQLGCPVRVFKGSERGELASSQDDSAWNDRLRAYQNGYLTPRVIAPFIDRLIIIGVLPAPSGSAAELATNRRNKGMQVEHSIHARGYLVWNAEADIEKDAPEEIITDNGYCIEWDDLDSLSDMDRAKISVDTTTALSAYVQGGVEGLIEPHAYLTKVIGWTTEEVDAFLEAAEEAQAEKAEEQQALADEHGMVPEVEGFKHPELDKPMPPMKVKEGEKLVDPSKIVGNEDEIDLVANEFGLSDAERQMLREIA